MSARDRILARLPDPAGGELRELDDTLLIEPQGDLWDLFVQRLQELKAETASLGELRSLPTPWIVDEDALPYLHSPQTTDDPWSAEVGVTLAECGVAETGTLVISAAPGRRRLASVAPPIHIALLPRDRLVATLEEAQQRINSRSTVWISGPSRTGDIEGVLVLGAHGPRRLVVVPVEYQSPSPEN